MAVPECTLHAHKYALAQDPAFLQRMEALMQEEDSDDDEEDGNDSEDDDGIIDVDAQGVPQQRVGRGLLSSLPGGEHINHKELADMEDIDWWVCGWCSSTMRIVHWHVQENKRGTNLHVGHTVTTPAMQSISPIATAAL